MVSSDIVNNPQSPVLIHDFESEGNLSNITKIVSVDISLKPGIIENIQRRPKLFPFRAKVFYNTFQRI